MLQCIRQLQATPGSSTSYRAPPCCRRRRCCCTHTRVGAGQDAHDEARHILHATRWARGTRGTPQCNQAAAAKQWCSHVDGGTVVQSVGKHAVVPLVGMHVACSGIGGGGQGAHLSSVPTPQVHPSGHRYCSSTRFSGSSSQGACMRGDAARQTPSWNTWNDITQGSPQNTKSTPCSYSTGSMALRISSPSPCNRNHAGHGAL